MNQINFADLNPASVEADIIKAYEQIAATTLYPGDPVRLFLEAVAYVLSVQNSLLDLAGKQNLLTYAQGGHLDALALMVGTLRLGAAQARTLQRFCLASPLNFDVHIPAGSRIATADGKACFATASEATIAAGNDFIDVVALANDSGTSFNGLVPGQINRLIDPLAYIKSTANISITSFGADIENDERLRARAQLAPEAFAAAGPIGAYRYHALSAHQDIADVAVWSPKPGTVDIRPILKNGELPSQEILDLVKNKLSASDVRPLTDTVIVLAPEIVEYSLSVSWSLHKANETLAASISLKIMTAAENYRLWQRSSPGRDINPTKLISLLEQAGAKRVMAEFDFIKLEPHQIARESAINIAYLGLEDE